MKTASGKWFANELKDKCDLYLSGDISLPELLHQTYELANFVKEKERLNPEEPPRTIDLSDAVYEGDYDLDEPAPETMRSTYASLIKLVELYSQAAAPVKLQVVQPNESKEVCKECGGKCCKNVPGIASPEQFGAPDKVVMAKNLREALSSGKWVVDWLEPTSKGYETRVLFPRPNILDNSKLYPYVEHGMWGGEGPCNFLTDTGCDLEFSSRPAQCQSLTPSTEKCAPAVEDYSGKYKMADLWKPYQNIIELAVRAAEKVREDW